MQGDSADYDEVSGELALLGTIINEPLIIISFLEIDKKKGGGTLIPRSLFVKKVQVFDCLTPFFEGEENRNI